MSNYSGHRNVYYTPLSIWIENTVASSLLKFPVFSHRKLQKEWDIDIDIYKNWKYRKREYIKEW